MDQVPAVNYREDTTVLTELAAVKRRSHVTYNAIRKYERKHWGAFPLGSYLS